MEGCYDMSLLPECEVVITESYPEEDDSKNITFLQNFIDVYKSLPELWNPKHPAYKNKAKRSSALDVMTIVYRKIKPNANHGDVRRKINTLRSNYRKDLNKIVASIKSGCSPDEVYRPTSWVFHALTFLQDCEQSDPNNKNQDEGSQNSIDSSLIERYMSEPPNTSHLQSPILSRSPTVSSLPPTKKQKLLKHLSQQKELSSTIICKCDKTKDNVPTVAKVWGEKYLALEMQQRLFAEKAINDILFEASLGSLHRNSVKINDEPNLDRTSVVMISSTSGSVQPCLTKDVKSNLPSEVKPTTLTRDSNPPELRSCRERSIVKHEPPSSSSDEETN